MINVHIQFRERTRGFKNTKIDHLKILGILSDELSYPLVIVLQLEAFKCATLRRKVPLYSLDLIWW